MAKDTFYNLEEEKRAKITEVLISEFSQKPFADVSVKTIVERLGIARGSFYQYFEDLERFLFLYPRFQMFNILYLVFVL
ncbi:TetR/AcrR family transcriptional regulator [Anaerococcus provencensis]|uniref:TetR/AcrR family transcriptional regulator n=1 Tax=Anaerococcus provencensis TaxID=938293 RepID=UPI0002E59817|nr:TetR/AcrR family transcriptional regulator [Anaerococcus provencensis]